MKTGVTSADTNSSCRAECDAMVGLASALTFAAAGTLLGYSFLAKERRLSIPVQLALGLVAGGAGVMTWRKRQEQLAAARNLIDHVNDVGDGRWLKKNPVAYG
jgi:hypothetical protein